MAFPGRPAPGRDLVLERLPWHRPASEGDRRHGRNRHPHGAGAGGTRNISGTNHPLVELERELADLHGKEAALVFTSGYVSNETGIASIARLLPNCVILPDAWNHNSMIEGVRRAGVEKKIWRHNDVGHLEELLGEFSWGEAGRNRGEQGALGRRAMAHLCPTLQPAFERGRIRPAAKRRAFPPRRLAVAVRRDAACAMKQSEIGVLLRQHRREIGDCRKDGQTDAPAVAILRPEQRHLPDDVGMRYAGRKLTMDGLGNDETEVVGEAVRKPLMPVRGEIGPRERGLHPDVAIAQLDRADRHVVRPRA
jgi:hypothetical protein